MRIMVTAAARDIGTVLGPVPAGHGKPVSRIDPPGPDLATLLADRDGRAGAAEVSTGSALDRAPLRAVPAGAPVSDTDLDLARRHDGGRIHSGPCTRGGPARFRAAALDRPSAERRSEGDLGRVTRPLLRTDGFDGARRPANPEKVRVRPSGRDPSGRDVSIRYPGRTASDPMTPGPRRFGTRRAVGDGRRATSALRGLR